MCDREKSQGEEVALRKVIWIASLLLQTDRAFLGLGTAVCGEWACV